MDINPELKSGVRRELDRLQYWQLRRETDRGEPIAVGDTVYYKDYKHEGKVIELLDGQDGRRDLVGRRGAMVSFRDRSPVPVFLWALRHAGDSPPP